jgi:predicted alpha/beta-fold hydrolase
VATGLAGPFSPSPWLPGAHAQTVYASLLAPRPAVAWRRARWSTPDGDFVDVDFAGPAGCSPLLVVFHGLEGNSGSHYARHLAARALASGWSAAVPHFRGCSGEPNLLPRAYHSGDTAELDWMLERLLACANGQPVHAVGVSLGGNVLLRWLGERGRAACATLGSAAAVCAPLDLNAAGSALERGFMKLYAWNFLRTLRTKALEKSARFPGRFDANRIRAARSLREFDDAYTAPAHGYLDVDDYWTRASSRPILADIQVPTLLLNALDDPFLPSSALPAARDLPSWFDVDRPDHGGHVGFVRGAPPGDVGWLATRIADFLAMPSGG